MWIDNYFPKLLGAELYRPHPAYIIEMAVEPVVVHDFSKQPGPVSYTHLTLPTILLV